MGSSALRERKVWQDYSGFNAAEAEQKFFEAFNKLFEGTDYRIRSKPSEFNKI